MECPTSVSSPHKTTQTCRCCREGNTKWEDLNLDDIDVRMKWAGMFHRRKKTPGKFMMRLKVGVAVTPVMQLPTVPHTTKSHQSGVVRGGQPEIVACPTMHHSYHSLLSFQKVPGGLSERIRRLQGLPDVAPHAV